MALQFTEMRNDRGGELAILDHDDGLDIAVSDQLIDEGQVLPLHL